MNGEEKDRRITRRDLLRKGIRGACVVGLGGAAGGLAAGRAQGEEMVWQIDPMTCIQCDKCATSCVLEQSAVRCVHCFPMCGYCDLCMGFFVPDPARLDTGQLNRGAENQVCPTGAIKWTFVEDPYYQYTIDEDLCNGCGKCAKGCNAFGNGSLILQIRHDRCLNCNDCAIALVCPSRAIKRVPADKPYLLKEVKDSE